MIVNQKENKRGFGVSEIIGIGTVLVIAAAIVIPGLKEISKDIIDKTKGWVSDEFDTIFNMSPIN